MQMIAKRRTGRGRELNGNQDLPLPCGHQNRHGRSWPSSSSSSSTSCLTPAPSTASRTRFERCISPYLLQERLPLRRGGRYPESRQQGDDPRPRDVPGHRHRWCRSLRRCRDGHLRCDGGSAHRPWAASHRCHSHRPADLHGLRTLERDPRRHAQFSRSSPP